MADNPKLEVELELDSSSLKSEMKNLAAEIEKINKKTAGPGGKGKDPLDQSKALKKNIDQLIKANRTLYNIELQRLEVMQRYVGLYTILNNSSQSLVKMTGRDMKKIKGLADALAGAGGSGGGSGGAGGGSGGSGGDGGKNDKNKDKESKSSFWNMLERGYWSKTRPRRVAKAGILGIGAFITGGLLKSHQKYEEEANSAASLAGTGISVDQKRQMEEAGVKWGYNPVDTINQSKDVQRATGTFGMMPSFQSLLRTTPLQEGEALGLFSAMARSGNSYQSENGVENSVGFKKQLDVLGDVFKSALDDSMVADSLNGLVDLISVQNKKLGGVVDPKVYSEALAFLAGGGSPGLQGERGAAALSSLNSTISGGKDDPWMNYAVGGLGRGNNLYNARKLIEEGATKTNIQNAIAFEESQSGGGQVTVARLAEKFNLTISLMEDIYEAYQKDKIGGGDKNLTKTMKAGGVGEFVGPSENEKLLSLSKLQAGLDLSAVKYGEENKDIFLEIKTILDSIFGAIIDGIATMKDWGESLLQTISKYVGADASQEDPMTKLSSFITQQEAEVTKTSLRHKMGFLSDSEYSDKISNVVEQMKEKGLVFSGSGSWDPSALSSLDSEDQEEIQERGQKIYQAIQRSQRDMEAKVEDNKKKEERMKAYQDLAGAISTNIDNSAADQQTEYLRQLVEGLKTLNRTSQATSNAAGMRR